MKRFALILAALALVALPAYAHDGDHEERPQRPTDIGFELFLTPKRDLPPKQTEPIRPSIPERHNLASTTEAEREAMKERLQERREHFASTTALRKAALAENVKERVLSRAEHVARLLDAMVGRLAGLADRIDSRIAVLKDAGADTADAERELREARAKIEEAADAVEDVKNALTRALESETPREALTDVKPLGDASKTAIREAHQALMEAVRALPSMGSAE